MAHIAQQQDPKQYTIYVLIHSFKREFYVGAALAHNTYAALSDHLRGKYRCTKVMCAECAELDEKPIMYRLGTYIATRAKAKNYQTIWTKFFIDKGYRWLDQEREFATVELQEQQYWDIYDTFKDKSFLEICNEQTRMHGDIGAVRSRKSDAKRTQIHMNLTPQEYQTIQQNAAESKRGLITYCKQMALEQHVFDFDYRALNKHLEEVLCLEKTLNTIYFAMIKGGGCYDDDLQNLRTMMQKILHMRADILMDMDDFRENVIRISRKQRPRKTKSYQRAMASNARTAAENVDKECDLTESQTAPGLKPSPAIEQTVSACAYGISTYNQQLTAQNDEPLADASSNNECE